MQQTALEKLSAARPDKALHSHPAPARSAPSRSGYLPILDGWRAVAIIGVLVCHGCEAAFHSGGLYPDAMLYRVTRYGSFGVDIFFGISGFLICTRLLQEHHRIGEISLPSFYIRRAFRILPPYLTYLIAMGVLGYSGALVVHRWEWLTCLLFFRNYIAQQDAGWYLGHFWSLAVEEHFYLIWPSMLVFFGPRRARWAAVLLALSVAGWRTLDGREQWISQMGGVAFYGRTDIRLDALLWGCWAALLIDKADWRELVIDRLSPGMWILLLGALMWCVAYQPPLAMLWQAILVPMVLVGTVLRPIRLVAWILEAHPLRWIGRISYSLYIWQQLFLVSSGEPRPLPLGILQECPINMIVVFVAAIASYYLIERPLINMGCVLSARIVNQARAEKISIGVGVVATE